MRKLLNSLAIYTLMAMSVSVFSNIGTTQAAFGVSPPWVKNDRLLPGTTLEEVIYLSRNETDQAMKAVIEIVGDEGLVDWISIQDENNLIMEKGKNILPMTVIVNVPEDAELKGYIGSISASLSPLGSDASPGDGEVAIALGARILVDISVIGDEITDYEIQSVSVESKEDNNPFSINVQVKNTGNTEVSDLEGQIEIYYRANNEVVKTLAFMPLDEPLDFNETREVEMVYQDYKPETGEYWVEVSAGIDGEAIYENRFLQKIVSKDVPAEVSEVAPASKLNNTYLIFGIVGLALGLAVIAGVIAVIRPKKRSKNNHFF